MPHNKEKNQERKDFIRLGTLVAVTGALWLSTMVNADAGVKKYDLEKACDYNIPQELINDKVSECLDAVNFNLMTLQIQIQIQLEQMRKDRQEHNSQTFICHNQ